MPQTAKRLETAPPVLEYAHVVSVDDRACLLAADCGELAATRATGCLLAPQPGDLVLASVDGAGRAFVLSVLARPEAAPGTIDYPGDVTLRTGGDLRLHGTGDTSLSAGATVTLAGEHGEAAFGSMSLLTKVARLRCKTLSVMAKAAEQLVGHLTQRLTNAVRLVADHEEVQAQSMRYCVADTLAMHAKNAQHIAEEVVKIDAGQVHLG